MVGKPIEVFMPFIGGTQDEKQYRVVMDRERWFQVLMGEEYRTDEFSTERAAERVPLPIAAAGALAFNLSIPAGQDAGMPQHAAPNVRLSTAESETHRSAHSQVSQPMEGS